MIVEAGLMPKILYYSSLTHGQGGAIKLMYKLANHFTSHPSFDVVVILPDGDGIAQKYRESGIPVRYVPFKRLGVHRSIKQRVEYSLSLPSVIRNIRKVIREEEVDIVHVNEVSFFAGLIAAKLEKIPAVCHVRVILRNRFPLARVFFAFLLRMFADTIIVSSQATGRGLFNKPEDLPTVVIYDSGADLKQFSPDLYERQELRKQYGVSDCFVVGLVSKLIPVKGHIYLIRAASLLERKYPDVDWKFVVVGSEVEGFENYAARLHQLIADLNLTDSFLFLGQRDDVPQLMYSFDVAVHVPDHDDPFPGVVLEALAMGRPFIGSHSGGIPEQFEDGVSGVLVPKGDAESLAEAIADFFLNPTKREAFGQAAREFVTSTFSKERHFGEVEQVYWQLLQTSKKEAFLPQS